MLKGTYKPEEIITKLREAEVGLSQGATVETASRWGTPTEAITNLASRYRRYGLPEGL